MPNQPLSRELAEESVAAVEDKLLAGFRPPGSIGKGPGAIAAAAIAFGINRQTFQTRLRTAKDIYGLTPDWGLWGRGDIDPELEVTTEIQQTDPLADSVLTALKKSTLTLAELSEKLNTTRGNILDAIDRLLDRGVMVERRGEQYSVDKVPVPAYASEIDLPIYTSRGDNTYVFGAVGDTHLGSKYERLDVLDDLYNRFAEAGVDRVFHTGNWVDGYGRQGFNLHDLKVHGLDQQMRYLAENYPQRTGITTYAVTGHDHEGWWAQREGIDPGKHAERIMNEGGRSDWVNLGYMEAHVLLENANSGKSAIMSVVHPGGGSAYALCFDDQTEILSEDGWKLFKNLKKGEKVATLNRETNKLEYQLPTDYTDQEYVGQMVKFSGDMVDLVITPNHRFWARRPWNRWKSADGCTESQKKQGYQFIEAGKVKGRDWAIPKTATWCGTHVDEIPIPRVPAEAHGRLSYDVDTLPAKPFLRLLGWFLSEGNLNHSNKQLEFSQQPGAYQNEIASLIETLGYKPYVWGNKVRLTSKQLYMYLSKTGRPYEKRVPTWIKDLSPELLWEFLEGYLRGDGCKALRGKGIVKWHSATTVSKQLADDLQELFVKVGLSATIRKQEGAVGHVIGNTVVKTAREQYVISINYEFHEPILTKPVWIPHTGKVYCVSVPNETILVRRNGKAVFTGNSYSIQKVVEALEGGEKPAIGLYGHYHKLWAGTIRNVWVVATGCTQDQTTFMRNKVKQEAHIGGVLVRLEQDPETGAIISMTPQIIRYFNTGYYNNRWSLAGPVNLPERVGR